MENAKMNGHEYVDLGLPSGLLWATCNVGATKPEKYGNYYAWGETMVGGDYYKWRDYKNSVYADYGMTKYNTTDGKTVLDLEDDAAHVNWGEAWRMPTDVEFDELIENCTWWWTTRNGVKGYKVVAPSGRAIFLPSAGFWGISGYTRISPRIPLTIPRWAIRYAGSDTYYWTSSREPNYPNIAKFIYLGLDKFEPHSNRDRKFPIRAVCSSK